MTVTEQLAREEIARSREQLAEVRSAFGNFEHAIHKAVEDVVRGLPFENEERQAQIAQLLAASALAQQAHDKAARHLLDRIKAQHEAAGLADEYA